MTDPGNTCWWILQWLASQPRSVLRAILEFSTEQWERLYDNWERATGIKRNRECEQKVRVAIKELEHLRQMREDYCKVLDGQELKQDVLTVLGCYTSHDELLARLEATLRWHRRQREES